MQIIGLIGANAPGGVSGNPDEWYLIIHCVAWRYPNTPVVERQLRLEMRVTRHELEEHMTALDPYQIIAVEAPAVDDSDTLQITAITDPNATDPDLATIAARLQVPVEMDHPVFGKLTYDRRFSCYQGRAAWGDRDVELMLDCPIPDQPGRAFETLEVLFREQADWSHRVNAYAAEQLLSLKNDVWLDEDEETLTTEAFISRMTLESISVDEDGEFTFWHNDGDLFWGHAIQISGDLIEGLNFADIPG